MPYDHSRHQQNFVNVRAVVWEDHKARASWRCKTLCSSVDAPTGVAGDGRVVNNESSASNVSESMLISKDPTGMAHESDASALYQARPAEVIGDLESVSGEAKDMETSFEPAGGVAG